MRAIVTGGAGFIGSRLVGHLRGAGWTVTVIDRATGPSIEGYPQLPADCDVIFHLASPVGPVGVLGQAGRIVPQVVETTEIVSQWARHYRCPLIDVSTSEVYGSGGTDTESDSCHFRAAPSARKEYGVAKLAAETMLLNTSGLDVRIVRPFNVAGPGQKPDGGFVLPRFIAQAEAHLPLTVYQPGTQRRAFTHVDDIVEGLVAVYERGRSGEVYNLGNPDNETTIVKLAEIVNNLTGNPAGYDIVDPTTIHGPAFREAPEKLPNARKALVELGWQPTRGIYHTVSDALLPDRTDWPTFVPTERGLEVETVLPAHLERR